LLPDCPSAILLRVHDASRHPPFALRSVLTSPCGPTGLVCISSRPELLFLVLPLPHAVCETTASTTRPRSCCETRPRASASGCCSKESWSGPLCHRELERPAERTRLPPAPSIMRERRALKRSGPHLFGMPTGATGVARAAAGVAKGPATQGAPTGYRGVDGGAFSATRPSASVADSDTEHMHGVCRRRRWLPPENSCVDCSDPARDGRSYKWKCTFGVKSRIVACLVACPLAVRLCG